MFINPSHRFLQSARNRSKRLLVACFAVISLGACASDTTASDTTASDTASDATQAPAPVEQPATAAEKLVAADTTLPPAPSTDDVFTTLEATGEYPTFVKLATQTGLADTLRTGGPFSVAVPTEEAFAALPRDVFDGLIANKVELARVLRYHIVPALITPEPAASSQALTLEGSMSRSLLK